MDVKRSRSPRAPAEGEDDKKRAGWRGGGGVRPEMVLVGFLLTLPLLFLVFGGRWGSGSFPSSSPSTPVVARNVAARNVAAAGRGATPPSKSKLSCPLLLPRCVRLVNSGGRVPPTPEKKLVDRRRARGKFSRFAPQFSDGVGRWRANKQLVS